jgi:6-phosphogluconolactonase
VANTTAHVQLSPDARYLYVSNRGHNSLACYQINAVNGTLKYVRNTLVEGKTPRNFTITPNGKYVLVACQDSEAITIFKRNTKTGALTFTGKQIDVSMPVHLLFL